MRVFECAKKKCIERPNFSVDRDKKVCRFFVESHRQKHALLKMGELSFLANRTKIRKLVQRYTQEQRVALLKYLPEQRCFPLRNHPVHARFVQPQRVGRTQALFSFEKQTSGTGAKQPRHLDK